MHPAINHNSNISNQTSRDRSRRKRVLKRGYISFTHQASTTGCVVRNLSETGALVQFDNPTILPTTFTLHVDLDGWCVKCTKVRQIGETVAVKFLEDKQKSKIEREQVVRSSNDPAIELKRREKELKQIIANRRMHGYKPDIEPELPPKPVEKHSKISFGRKA